MGEEQRGREKEIGLRGKGNREVAIKEGKWQVKQRGWVMEVGQGGGTLGQRNRVYKSMGRGWENFAGEMRIGKKAKGLGQLRKSNGVGAKG
jgi:hypothetical protein